MATKKDTTQRSNAAAFSAMNQEFLNSRKKERNQNTGYRMAQEMQAAEKQLKETAGQKSRALGTVQKTDQKKRPGDWMDDGMNFITYTGDYANPFKGDFLNGKYTQAVKALNKSNKKKIKTASEMMRDAFLLVDGGLADFGQEAAALQNYDRSKSGVYLKAAQDNFAKMLDRKKAEYEAEGLTGSEMLELLAGTGYKGRGQRLEEDEAKYQEWLKDRTPEENPDEEWIRMMESLRENDRQDVLAAMGGAGELWTRLRNGEAMYMNDAELTALQELGFLDMPENEQAQITPQQAQERGAALVDAYANRDRQAAEEGPYDEWLKTLHDDLEDQDRQAVLEAMSNAGELWTRLRNGEAMYMNDAELTALQELGFLDLPGNEQAQITPQQAQERADEMLSAARGIWQAGSAELTPYQEELLKSYRSSLEGAEAWVKDAEGTDEEEQARENLWFVTEENKFSGLEAAPDYAQNSQYFAPEDFRNRDDLFYGLVNGDPKAMEAEAYSQQEGNANTSGIEYSNMTPEEKAKFNYMWNNGRRDEAKEYLDYMSYALNARWAQQAQDEARALAEKGPVGATVASLSSVAMSPLRGAGYLDMLWQAAQRAAGGEYRPLDRNRGANQIGQITDAYREGVMGTTDWMVNILGKDIDLFDFIYGTGMSGMDSLLAGAVGGGTAAGAILGLGAAQNAMQDIYDREGNDRQAMIAGLANGIFEGLFESISIGKFYDEAKTLGKDKFAERIWNVIAQTGINASEEFNTAVADMVFDTLLMGDKSEFEQKKKYYYEHGLTGEGEADARALWDFCMQAMEEGAGGALMGSWFGTLSSATSASRTRGFDKRTGSSIISQKTQDTLKEIALTLPKGSEARTLGEKYVPGKAGARATGKLYRSLYSLFKDNPEMRTAMAGRMTQDVAEHLAGSVETDGGAAAAAIVDLYSGEEITQEQMEAIAHNKDAMDVMGELMGVREEAEAGEAEKPAAQAKIEETAMPAAEETTEEKKPAAPAQRGLESLYGGEETTTAAKETQEEMPPMGTEEETQQAPAQQPAQAESEETEAETPEEPQKPAAPILQTTTQKEDGSTKETTVQTVKMSEDGETTATLADGSKVDVDELDVDDSRKELLQQAARMDQEAGRDMVAHYEDGQDPTSYAIGYKRIMAGARAGYTLEEIHTLYGKTELTEAQQQAAYEAGRREAARMEAEKAKINRRYAKQEGYGTLEDAGQDGTGVLFGNVTKKLTGSARGQLAIIDAFAKKYGLQVRAYDTLGNANANYETGSNIINLGLDADDGALTRVVSHEGFHYIKNWNGEAAQQLQDLVLESLRNTDGYDLDARVREMQERYSRGGQELSEADALEEIAAESMLDVIGSKETVQQLMKENPGLAAKIRDWLKQVMQDLQSALKRFSKDSPEAKALLPQIENVQKWHAMYNDALAAAQENYIAAQQGATQSAKQDTAVTDYMQDMEAGADAQDALNGLVSQLFFQTQGDWIQEHMDADMDEALRNFSQALMDYRKNETALSVELEKAGFAAPEDMSALSYAADQLVGREERTGETPGVKYELKQEPITNNGIVAGMDDLERYRKLEGSKITAPDATNYTSSEEMQRFHDMRNYNDLEEELAKKAKVAGLITEQNKERLALKNRYLSIAAYFSKKNLKETIQKQKGGKANLAALIPVFQETYENAVPIQVQGDRYLYSVKDESRNKAIAYLLGAFRYNGQTIPVQFELKQSEESSHNNIYIVATIKEDAVIAPDRINTEQGAGLSSNINIADVIQAVKGNDKNILANLPAQFLTKEQLQGKREKLQEQGATIRRNAEAAGKNTDAPVNMTADRIDAEIKNYGSTTNPNYSKAYMTYINPADFLDLTTSKRERIENESRAMNAAEMRENRQTPFLKYDPETGEVTGHEGRHRMAALANAGVENIAILMIPDGEAGRSNRQNINSLQVSGQDFGSSIAPGVVDLENLVPVNSAHRQELIDTFSESDNWFKYNMKREDVASDVEDDAALYAQVQSDQDAREALEVLNRLDESARAEAKGAWEKRLPEIANKIIMETGSKISRQKLNWLLKNLYTAMEDENISLGEKVMYARQAVKEAMKTGGSLREADETTREALRLIRTRGFYLTDDMKSEIRETYGSVQAYMRKNFGKMAVRARGTRTSRGTYASLLDLWSDLNELMPGTFEMTATEADMPAMLDAFVEQAGNREYDAYYGADGEAFATDLAYRTMLEYYDVPTAMKRTQEIRQEFRQRLEDYRTSFLQKQEEKARASKERAEATARKEKLRGEISRDVKYLNTRTVAPTDTRHIPEALRAAVTDAIEPFTQSTGVWSAEKAAQLRREYKLLKESNTDARSMYDEEIADKIERVEKALNGRTLSQLTEAELQDIRDIIGNLKHMVDEGNAMLVNGQRVALDQEAGQFIHEMEGKTQLKNKILRGLKNLSYRNMTPTYYADQVGGVVKAKIQELFDGQNKWAFTMKGAKEKAEALADTYHLNDWINSEHLRFTTQRGETLELSRGEALALYATWKRETSNRRQNANHLRIGGFTYGPKAEYEGVDTRKPHAVTAQDMQQVMDYLGEEQMAYADEMVKYLSQDMAALGNETSMALYGYNKFGEGYYFPYSSDRRFTYAEFGNQQETGSKQIKNAGMTKATVKNASNPVILGDFLDVWANHVNQMALYNAFAVTSTDLNRLLNFSTTGQIMVDSGTGREDLVEAQSLRLAMENALGKDAVQYLQTLLTDVNGGVRTDERTAAGKLISLFKKGSVAANASVTLQQPSAIMRAMYMVNPKYFLKMNPARIAQNIQEMETYSGVAIIKHMGRFDTGTGKSATEWLNDYVKEGNKGKALYNKMDEWAGMAPEWADRATWAALWNAVKNEVAATMPGIEADNETYMQAVAERFNDVVNHTQVYDSTLSKSTLMRSQSLFDKIATSFMAEPTVSFNMLLQGMQQLNTPGGRARAGRAVGAFVAATVLNALLKSFATMGRRKDDDERTVIEKYLGEVVENMGEDLSPQGIISLVPLARDVVSIFQGYDVSRSDMDVVEQLYGAVKVLENENKTAWEKISAVAGAVGSATGVPVKNVLRDIGGVFNVFRSAPISETSGRDIQYTVLDSLPSILGIELWDSARKAYYDRIEDAMIKGNDKAVEEMSGYLKETEKVKETTLESGVKNAMKESVARGILTQDRAAELLTKYFGKDPDKAFFEVEKWQQEMEHKEDEDYSYSQYREVRDLVKEGKDITEAMKKLTSHGKSEKDVRSDIKSAIGEWYRKGDITDAQAKSQLKKYVPSLTDNDIYWTIEEWDWKKSHKDTEPYNKYNDLKTSIEKRSGIDKAIRKLTDHGVKKDTIASQITTLYKPTYVALVKAGKTVEAANLKAALLTAYEGAGKDRDKKNKDIDKWLKD